MAKLGRYSADRKKIEALSASKTLAVADCGTNFTLEGNTAFTITLPSSPSAGDTVIIANAGAATVTVGRNSSNINSAATTSTRHFIADHNSK